MSLHYVQKYTGELPKALGFMTVARAALARRDSGTKLRLTDLVKASPVSLLSIYHLLGTYHKLTGRRMPANIVQPGQGDSLQQWFKDLPFVTKVLTIGTLFSGAAITFGFLGDDAFLFYWPYVRHKFHIWRFFTSFIYAGKFSFNYIMHLYVLYENCKRYEAGPFNTGGGGNSSDFLWMIMLGMAVLCVVGYFFEMQVLSESLLYMIMYVWSRRDPNVIVSIFGFKLQVIYLPWFYIAMRLLMGGSISQPLIGVAVGHAYYFCIEVLPLMYGYDPIRTPQFCCNIIAWYTGGRSSSATSGAPAGVRGGFRAAAAAAPAAARGFASMGSGHNWGRGRQLGSN